MGTFRKIGLATLPEGTVGLVAKEDSAASSNVSSVVETLTEQAGCFIFSYSPRLRSLISWSDNAQTILGVKDPVLIRDANLFLRFVHSEDQFRVLSALEASMHSNKPYKISYRWIRPDTDEVRWLHCQAAIGNRASASLHTDAGIPSEESATSAERLLEGAIFDLGSESVFQPESSGPFSSVSEIFSNLPQLVFVLDRDLHVVFVNVSQSTSANGSIAQNLLQNFGFGDPLYKQETLSQGRNALSGISDETIRSQYLGICNQIMSGSLPAYRTKFSHRNLPTLLDLIPWSDAGRIRGIIGIVQDANEIIRLERQLTRMRKTEGLRSLASGVSHHINNALQGIIGQATVINTNPDETEAVCRASAGIIDLVRKTSELSSQLFALEDPQRAALTPLDLNLAVMSAVSGVEELFSSAVEVEVTFGNPSPILGKQSSFVELLQELLCFARNLVVQTGKTVLLIRTAQVDLQGHEKTGLHAGRYSKLSLSGVTLTTTSHTPFPNALLEQVDELGGTLLLEEEAEKICTVALYLPALVSQQDSLFAVSPDEAPEILVIDDDSLVSQTITSILSSHGFACTAAQSGARALALARTFKNSLKVVLIDAIIPGEDTEELLRNLKQALPHARALGFSGASTEFTEHLLRAGAERILQKPIDPTILTGVLRGFLQPRQASAA